MGARDMAATIDSEARVRGPDGTVDTGSCSSTPGRAGAGTVIPTAAQDISLIVTGRPGSGSELQ